MGIRWRLGLSIAVLVAGAAPNSLAIDATWNFDGATPLAASLGGGTIVYFDPLTSGWGPAATQFGSTALFGLPAFPDGGLGGVLRVPQTTPSQGYQVFAGGAATGDYTMIWDFLSPPAADGKWRGLLQTSLANANDGDFFLQNIPSGGVGIQGIYHGAIPPNTWNRIAMTRSASGTISKYINGTLVGTQAATDPRFALETSFLLFADEDNETAVGYLSSFRYVDGALSGEQVRLLGNVSAAGATAAGPTIPPLPPASAPPLFGRTQIIGHRGGGTLAPENTLAAFAKGFQVGADLFEFDIHLTSDGHAVVLHDDTLDRTTNGAGPVASMTLAQVQSLDAGSWFGPQYAGERVPTLAEALAFTAGRGRALLDVKVPPNQALRDEVYAAILASGASLDDIWVWPANGSYSSDPRFGSAEVQLLSSVPSNLSDANLSALKASGVDGMAVADGTLTQAAINAFHRNGLWVDAYTVSDPARLAELIAMGVDSIETDRPDLMAGLIYGGDADADFDVDGTDLLAWQRQGNLAAKLSAWQATFGHERGIPAAARVTALAVPEPASAAILAAALLTMGTCWRRS